MWSLPYMPHIFGSVLLYLAGGCYSDTPSYCGVYPAPEKRRVMSENGITISGKSQIYEGIKHNKIY